MVNAFHEFIKLKMTLLVKNSNLQGIASLYTYISNIIMI